MAAFLRTKRMDYEVQRCTRHCAVSGRELGEGEEFFSVLIAEGSVVRRFDYSLEHWQGAPATAMSCWKSRMPTRDAHKQRLTPGEVLLELFQEWADQPDKADIRYVMALLLVRRRVLRLDETEHDELGGEVLVLQSPRDESVYRVLASPPTPQRAVEIQQDLEKLLYADAS
jgi:hypothetical protein